MSKSLRAAVLLAALAAAGCTERQPGGVALDMSYCQSVPSGALKIVGCPPPPRTGSDIDRGRYDLQLAEMYLDGTGVPRDEAKAFYLASDASVAGDIDAKELLGRLYATGRGTPRDDELATNLFRTAVDAGNVAALTELGQMIETGRGTKSDPESALDYYERAMDAGAPEGRSNYQRLKKVLEAPKPKKPPAGTTPTVTKQVLPPSA